MNKRKQIIEEEAFTFETDIIKLIGRKDENKGPLVNFTNGGEGASNKNWWVIYRKNRMTTSKIVNSLQDFCRENDLSYSEMICVANAFKKHHKGWKCVKICRDDTNLGIYTKKLMLSKKYAEKYDLVDSRFNKTKNHYIKKLGFKNTSADVKRIKILYLIRKRYSKKEIEYILKVSRRYINRIDKEYRHLYKLHPNPYSLKHGDNISTT